MVWALAGSFQNAGLSESAFSSSRRFSATPQSKPPPQQPDRLPDRLDHVFEFRLHWSWPLKALEARRPFRDQRWKASV